MRNWLLTSNNATYTLHTSILKNDLFKDKAYYKSLDEAFDAISQYIGKKVTCFKKEFDFVEGFGDIAAYVS